VKRRGSEEGLEKVKEGVCLVSQDLRGRRWQGIRV
jgi:hypothetical protein